MTETTSRAADALPAATPPFEMHVQNAFRLSDGRTVLVGPVVSGPSFVEARRCDLVVDGRVVQTIALEGEMIPLRSQPQPVPRPRSVSTLDAVAVDKATLQAGRCRLLDHAG